MIREYQIINVELHQADEDDEEVIATVRDVISCDEFYVVINDYFLEHYPEHLIVK